MIATLHTFGRSLIWNPHIHALVPELVYDQKTKKIKEVNYFDYANLRKTWQYELNRLLLEYFGKQFRRYMNKSYIDQYKGFYVYAPPVKKDDKPVSDHVEGCVNYMMRYASRPAMAESRITSYNKETDEVEWFYDDHKTQERIVVKETGRKLVEKIIIHIPNENFRMIRYYGFYNNKEQKLLDEIHNQLGEKQKIKKTKEMRAQMLKTKQKKQRFRTLCIDSFNRDPLRCKCGCIMSWVDSYDPFEKHYHNDRNYRQNSIDEMREMWLHRKHSRFRA
jgi:hypothetical protein